MFLKKIEMQGFKSFADKVVINFQDEVTGIVGPNGCGKSNISDAIRWVLGEQSSKSLRGTSMTDVIFNGSENRKKVNLAEVTLVFNNERKALNSDYEEVEVTRRLFRDTRESEYLINKVPCRLRDIHDLVLDTGLGRDSLSIISQGTISYFAEAKPIERRVIFEDAAGVSKYKKRKIESINKLERTKENMDRMQDIVDEITRQVNSLKRAAKKAEIYVEKRDLLKSIEVSVLCKDITDLNGMIKEGQAKVFELQAQLASLETNVGVYDHELEEKRNEIFKLDQEVSKGQETMMKYIHEVGVLETRRIETDERRKYAMEVGDKKAKAKELKAMLNDAKIEFDDRKKRHQELNAAVEILVQSNFERNQELADKTVRVSSLSGGLNTLKNRLDVLEHRISRPFEGQQGVQAIMDNKASLHGVHDAIGNIFTPHDSYETAITTALAGSIMHIVTTSDKDAVNAINFLKNNRSGRATFIPMSVVRPRSVQNDALTVSDSVKGYLGVASDFVDNDETYADLRDSLLGNVLIVETIENANTLAKRLNHAYKIVTLDGDVIHRGGVMSGGRSKGNNQSMLTLRKDKEDLEKEVLLKQENLVLEQNKLNALQTSLREASDELMGRRISLAQIEPVLDAKRARYENLKQEFEDLNPEELDLDVSEDDGVSELNALLMKRDELGSTLSLLRERRNNLSHDVKRKEASFREDRSELNALTSSLHGLDLELTKQQTRVENNLERLSSVYQMTYEYAYENVYNEEAAKNSSEVLQLRGEIANLGNVNLEAPEEYKEAQERYDFLSAQLDELVAARDKLLAVIDEMDEIMIVQFKEMFDKINDELNEVFTKLFGGGKARLILEDENDLLNTGIDIDVQPPGKSVQNIRLFSGGEKSLIAISVLFAILKARHVPLCIFDEVEAALDQANVERLANYIKNFADNTQFILITHRPGTMAQCDVLYGVTMPTKGVSNMLRVKLEEAVELREA
ncbi:MAG: chromosome segregation protein SMC [Erysipelothrix sp.]|nr:chromosome segregation protein SMC [Erysipelothrix sp.]